MDEQVLEAVAADMKLAWAKANEVVPRNSTENRNIAVAIIAAVLHKQTLKAEEKRSRNSYV